MKTIIPDKLQKNDEIRIIAPSFSAGRYSKKLVVKAKKKLESLGFKVSFAKNINEIDFRESSSIESRIEDLTQAFTDRNVKAIMCVCGGYIANELLEYIDFSIIQDNPKIFIGYSDITVLLNAINTKTGLVTYLGPNFIEFGNYADDCSIEAFLRCLTQKKEYSLEAKNIIGEESKKKQVIYKITKSNQIIDFQQIKGEVVAGNLCSLNLLQGTTFMPNLSNKILFIEEDCLCGKSTGLEFDRNLEFLLQMPGANEVKGFVFGKFEKKSNTSLKFLKQLLKNKPKLQNKLLIINADFGHTLPNLCIPIGAEVEFYQDPNLKISFSNF